MQHWYILCSSRELQDKPLARTLFDMPLVLFRGEGGKAAALLDRCAHRNVPLSVGQVRGAMLECRYHGWRYDNQGLCRRVPALVAAAEGKARRVPAHAVREQQGYVWVYATPDVVPTSEPFTFPHVGERGFHAVHYGYRFEASLYATLENILDVPHTAFLHRGLFRSPTKQNKITAVVRRQGDRVEAEYIGEPVPAGVLGKVLAPRGGHVIHYDRFIVPSIAQVEYALGKSCVVITDVLTPLNDFVTELRTVVALRLPAAGLVSRVLAPIAVRVAKQDAAMLKLQSTTVQRFAGEQFVSTDVDILGPHILRLLRQAERNEIDVNAPVVEERVELMA